MREGAPDHIPNSRKPLSKKASRIFLFGVIVATLLLSFLTALGIKSASENEAFQEEVQEMRRQYDPNYEDPDAEDDVTPTSTVDSTSSVNPSN